MKLSVHWHWLVLPSAFGAFLSLHTKRTMLGTMSIDGKVYVRVFLFNSCTGASSVPLICALGQGSELFKLFTA